MNLKDIRGWNNLGFVIERNTANGTDPSTIKLTLADCKAGFQAIIDTGTNDPACQGYSGRKLGDRQGNWAGGSSGTGDTPGTTDVNKPRYYMYVERPT